jgi:hypothetical protein
VEFGFGTDRIVRSQQETRRTLEDDVLEVVCLVASGFVSWNLSLWAAGTVIWI